MSELPVESQQASFDRRTVEDRVRSILDRTVARGDDLGCRFVMYADGEKAVDVCAGYADAAKTVPVGPGTLFPVFSCGKAVAVAAVLRLCDKGEIDLDTKIADVWPEFGVHGKDKVTLEMVLRHQSGVFEYPKCESREDIGNWAEMCRQVAAMRPAWTPGDKTHYQSLDFTWLLCEPIQRMTGRSFSDILRTEVFEPAGLEDMYFGIGESAYRRCAELVRGESMPPVPEPDVWHPIAEMVVDEAVRGKCLVAGGCITNADSLARFYAALIGTLPGKEPLVSPQMLEHASLARPGMQETATSWGLGFALFGPPDNRVNAVGHSGSGGSEGMAVPDERIAIAFTRNLLRVPTEDDAIRQIYRAIGLRRRH